MPVHAQGNERSCNDNLEEPLNEPKMRAEAEEAVLRQLIGVVKRARHAKCPGADHGVILI
jgi:hypothetical protein